MFINVKRVQVVIYFGENYLKVTVKNDIDQLAGIFRSINNATMISFVDPVNDENLMVADVKVGKAGMPDDVVDNPNELMAYFFEKVGYFVTSFINVECLDFGFDEAHNNLETFIRTARAYGLVLNTSFWKDCVYR